MQTIPHDLIKQTVMETFSVIFNKMTLIIAVWGKGSLFVLEVQMPDIQYQKKLDSQAKEVTVKSR